MVLIPAFFGLSPKDKPILHAQLFDMVYSGHGFTWTELYDMPVWLRKFYFKKIQDALLLKNKNQAAENKKASKPAKFAKPAIRPRR